MIKNLGQEEIVHRIKSLMTYNPISEPILNLKEVAVLAQLATVFVGGDTGPMHVAAAAGGTTVAMFTSTSPPTNALSSYAWKT